MQRSERAQLSTARTSPKDPWYARIRPWSYKTRAASSGQRLSGHPSRPPVTDVSIGAYTVATAMFILGALGHRGEHRWNRRSASPLRGLIFAAPACGARGTELLKARKVIEVLGNVSALREQVLEPDRRRRPPARRPRRPRPRPGEGVVRRPSATLSCASCTRSGSWTARRRRVRGCLTRVAAWPRCWAGRLLASASTAVRSSLRPSDGGAAGAAETREASRCRLRAG